MTIGDIHGKFAAHSDSLITAVFDIPYDEEIGTKDVAITFQPPQGDPLIFSKPNGFTVNKMPDTAPVIAAQPKSKAVRIGSSVTLAIKAYGSLPLSYQWQKNGKNLLSDTSASLIIAAFSEADTGSYRCVVSNSFGTDTSEVAVLSVDKASYEGNYPIVDTGQHTFFDDLKEIAAPAQGEPFYGQDAQYQGNEPSYTDNGDSTVTDNVTGLMWQQSLDHNGDGKIDVNDKLTYDQILSMVESGVTFAGYDDWRMPTAKELFSIENFDNGWSYLATDYFDLAGDKIDKDQQYWISNHYVGVTTEGRDDAAFGVNFATGHIKAYPANSGGPIGGKFVRAIRGEPYAKLLKFFTSQPNLVLKREQLNSHHILNIHNNLRG